MLWKYKRKQERKCAHLIALGTAITTDKCTIASIVTTSTSAESIEMREQTGSSGDSTILNQPGPSRPLAGVELYMFVSI